MPTLLDVDEVREHVESDLTDTALTRLIEDADAEIIARLGAVATATEVRSGDGLTRLPLNRVATAVTSVVMRVGQTDYALGTDDYVLVYNGRMIERRQGSTYPDLIWHGTMTVVYVPRDETTRRTRLLIDLVKLAVNYDGMKSADIGDARTSPLDYKTERDNLFAPFAQSGRAWIV